VPIASFLPSRSQRRVLKRCRDVKVAVAAPSYTEEKYAIYCEHKERFGDSDAGSRQDFQASFYLPCPGALEFTYRLNGELVAIGLVNEAPDALSSVYFFFRTAHSALSLGTFGVLKEIEAATQAEKQWLYLGYWIEANASMRYKSDFRPNEILGRDGVWRPFRDHKNDYLQSPLTRFHPFPTALSRHRIDRG
jgi:arginine-tRNA-protein transferase